MVMPRSKLALINGLFLVVSAPMLVRLWVEAVLWRIERGPQMLAFSLMHGGAGALTVPLVVSLVTLYVYGLFALVIAVAWLIPSVRARITGIGSVLLGVVGASAFQALAILLQRELPTSLLYVGAIVLSAVLVFLFVVAVNSFREGYGVHVV